MGLSHHLKLTVFERGRIQRLGHAAPFFSQDYSYFFLNLCHISQALRIGIAATYEVELAQDEIIPLDSALGQSPKEEI